MMDAQHHVLGDVFGFGCELLAENGHGQAKHRSAIPPYELRECGIIRRLATLLDEPLVSPIGVRGGVSARARRQGRIEDQPDAEKRKRQRQRPEQRGIRDGYAGPASHRSPGPTRRCHASGAPAESGGFGTFSGIERELRQRNALVHSRHALLVEDFEAPLPLEVPEVEIRHECRGERCDDDAVPGIVCPMSVSLS